MSFPFGDSDQRQLGAKSTDYGLLGALRTVQQQVHPSLNIHDDALQYIESLIVVLLRNLCQSKPHNLQDVELAVKSTLPHPMDKWAITDAQTALEKGKKKHSLVLPFDKLHALLLSKEFLGFKCDMQVAIYFAAVLEYIAADILKLVGNYVRNIKHKDITKQDVTVAMNGDKVLMDLFFPDSDASLSESVEMSGPDATDMTYEKIVRDLILEEQQYYRDLNIIIRVFRAPFEQTFQKSKDLDVIFSNIIDIQELTANLLNSLEETQEVNEMTEKDSKLTIGTCFDELLEGEDFEIYERYADDILKPHGRERLSTLLQRSDISIKLQVSHLYPAAKYVLPKLLLGPIYHFIYYGDVLKALIATSEDDSDRSQLQQASGLLNILISKLEHKLANANLPKKKPGIISLRFQGQVEKPAAIRKLDELDQIVDGFDSKSFQRTCNEFIMEGTLTKYVGKRVTERHVFLFDNVIILTKTTKRTTSVLNPGIPEYKLKETFLVRRINTADKEDSDDGKHMFEIQPREGGPFVLATRTAEEKTAWMSVLILLQSRSVIERMLDAHLDEEEKRLSLQLPRSDKYRFAEEDSDDNIIFEGFDDSKGELPIVKGGTLVKLVERLTHHVYVDPKYVRTYLTTYRTFCRPEELLDLLIERFDIPDPCATYENGGLGGTELKQLGGTELKQHQEKMLAKFRKKYRKPVQFQVLNAVRHWVDEHWYDFEDNELMQNKLNAFLEAVKGKVMRKWVDSIAKIIARKSSLDGEAAEKVKVPTLSTAPPPIEWHLTQDPAEFNILTLHPLEIARQVTLLEFDLFRAVKPSEIVGSVWVKEQKYVTSPNLLRMIQFSTRFTFWMEKCVVEAENLEERVAVVCRLIEIMVVFQELNNFSGMIEVVSALNSACIHRLEWTLNDVRDKKEKLKKAFDDASELISSNHYKKYFERLRSINPPCVPFMGVYLTNILFTEEANPDFLPNRREGLINFSKRRKVAEITSEIQQYQNDLYCLHVEPSIRSFFENLNPMENHKGEREFIDYLFEKSLQIEPRRSLPAKFERKWDCTLKSPGIKPSAGRPTPRPERHHSLQLPSTLTLTLHGSHCPINQDGDFSPPGTPISATSDGGDDSSIFSPAPQVEGPRDLPPMLPLRQSNAPPLPPRRKRDSTASDVSSSPRPDVPPRGGAGIVSPPPVPPRQRDSQRAYTSPLPGNSNNNMVAAAAMVTLPRHYSTTAASDNVVSNGVGGGPHSGVGAGGEPLTPALPPKTYHRGSQHRRQQSR